jgi:histidyl-tRNA synthetase
VRIVVDAADGGFKPKLRRADRSGAPIALILGDDELASGCIQVKSMRNNTQQSVALERAADQINDVLESLEPH